MKRWRRFILTFVFVSFASFAFGDVKTDIYSKLKCCPCKESFDKCLCKEAKEMKAYIDALLESGIAKEGIFYKIAKKYSLNTIIDKQIKQDIEKRFIKEAGEKRPQIELESTHYDFGKVSKRQGKISKNFKLYNKGSAGLIITNIRVSCSCVTASLKVGRNKSPYFSVAGAGSGWQVKIEPGGLGELEVALDLAHQSMAIGKEARDVFISSNDPVYPQVILRVEAEVRE
jgi:LEA14-like dessication related protein